ncbi:MAG: hypothetical protein FJ288_18180, partial [Planctomycetes bacterium]|nr:hypothetical protein [Planctomycetota bacterium]
MKGPPVARQIGEILLSPRRIAARVRRLGAALARAYAGRDPLLVAVMKGCVVFVADLVRVWPGPLDLEFVSAESYVGTRPGRVRVALPPGLARRVAGRPVLVIDDIYDTGATLAEVCRALEALRPAEIRSLVMFRRKRPPRAARPRTGAMLSRRCESMPRPRSALAATRAACTVPPDRPLRPPPPPRGRP